MGGATLEQTVRTVTATLVADAPLAETVQLVADLACALAPAAVAATLSLVDERGRPVDEVRAGATPDGTAVPDGARLSVPLLASGRNLGTITVYAREAGSFTDADTTALEVFADQAAVVLANAQAYWDLQGVAAGLQSAMQSRAVIEQAKGVLIATQGCTPDEAFALLARTSQRDNVKLRELARQIVDGTFDGTLAGP
jgi:GAF domain-containing protein